MGEWWIGVVDSSRIHWLIHMNHVFWVQIPILCSQFINWIHTITPHWQITQKLYRQITMLNCTMKWPFSSSWLNLYYTICHKPWFHKPISSLRSFALNQSLLLQNSCRRRLLLVDSSVPFFAEVHHASLYIISYYELAYWNQYMTQYEQ